MGRLKSHSVTVIYNRCLCKSVEDTVPMRVQAESFWYLNLGNVKERLIKSYFQRCRQPKGETQCAGDQKQQQRPRASSTSLGSKGKRGGAVTRTGRETCGGQAHQAEAVTLHPPASSS